MERKIEKTLAAWKDKPNRKPLLLQGARQVGKTYASLDFGKAYYQNCVYFNLEGSTELAAIFKRDLDPQRILRELSVRCGQSIFKQETLIILDEIQACPRALTSLKYFCENAPEYHVIAAGSLLGVAVKREQNFSFPVGKVDMVTMYPMDFEEFLWATHHRDLADLIRESYEDYAPLSLHDMALDLYKTYLVVGGMPQAVAEYVRTSDFNYVTAVHHILDNSYTGDMPKYATAQEAMRIRAAWQSISAQLAKDNHKFQYKIIKSGARAYEYREPLDWLQSAGLILRCGLATEGKMPLSAYEDHGAFKVYMLDVGMLCSKFDIAPNVVLTSPHSFDGFKGALAENYIMQALVTGGFKPYYWASDGKAEVDFVFQDRQGNIIPLEAKSADNVRARSLRTYADRYKPAYQIRVSARNFGHEGNMKSIPLYALFCLEP